ncbi:MAG TPA: hypothetical protein VJT09_05905 [Pyrinomonadaceae bacterium]|nr:hypothetical protein [Pyrinomonadaceae bacterium]
MRLTRLCLLAVLLTVFCSVEALGDATTGDFKCSAVSSKLIASNQVIFLRCDKGWPTGWAPAAAQVEIWDTVDPRFPHKIGGTISVQSISDTFIRITIDGGYLLKDQRYLVVLKLPRERPRDVDAIVDPDLIAEISTAPGKATITQSTAARDVGRVFTVKSPVAIQSAGKQELVEKRQAGGTDVLHAATVAPPRPLSLDDPETVGRLRVTLPQGRELRQNKATLKVDQVTDVFGQPITIENPVTIAAPPPKGKDDATQYYQISYAAGRGSKPSYGINFKTKALPLIPGDLYWGDFLIQPNVVVDIGTNTFAKKTDDTISLGVTGTKIVCCADDNKAFFQGIKFGPGAAYETNRGFHKNNLLATFDSNPLLRGFVNPREERRRQLAVRLKKESVEEVDPSAAKFGYGLEFFFGLEAGGSPSAQTFKNKSKTASLDIPTYSIFRFRPRTHAFLEYDRVTLDMSHTIRLLGTPEYAGEELPDQTVRLRRILGWQSYLELTGSFGIDQSKHLTFAVTYKRGAQPPNFPHVNSVQSGFILKY